MLGSLIAMVYNPWQDERLQEMTMTSVTVELPETLSQAIQQRRIPRQRLDGAVISFLEFFVRELDQEATAPLRSHEAMAPTSLAA